MRIRQFGLLNSRLLESLDSKLFLPSKLLHLKLEHTFSGADSFQAGKGIYWKIHFARMTVFGVDHKEAHNFAFQAGCQCLN